MCEIRTKSPFQFLDYRVFATYVVIYTIFIVYRQVRVRTIGVLAPIQHIMCIQTLVICGWDMVVLH